MYVQLDSRALEGESNTSTGIVESETSINRTEVLVLVQSIRHSQYLEALFVVYKYLVQVPFFYVQFLENNCCQLLTPGSRLPYAD